jgi:hypothetical protein
MSTPKGTWGTLENGQRVLVPEKGMAALPPGTRAVPLHGVKYSKAVMRGERCLGWVSVSDEEIAAREGKKV